MTVQVVQRHDILNERIVAPVGSCGDGKSKEVWIVVRLGSSHM